MTMGFKDGSVTFRRYKLEGNAPTSVTQEMLDTIAGFSVSADGTSEIQYGWSGGRHIFDNEFSFENNVFADSLNVAVRIDTRKVPGDVRKAYLSIEEEALAKGNPSGFISKLQKRDAKIAVRQRCEAEIKEGKWSKSKIIHILWDLSRGILYTAASGPGQEQLIEIFERSFDLILKPISSGSFADDKLDDDSLQAIIPQKWVDSAEDPDMKPEYPWVAKGKHNRDFLGNEFLLWLWFHIEELGGEVVTSNGVVTVYFDKTLDLECSYGQTGKDTLRGDGPHRMVEAKHAVLTGKVPRKVGMIMDHKGNQYTFKLNAETFTFGSTRLPEVENAETPRTLFEERITLLADMGNAMDSLYGQFLDERSDAEKWGEAVESIKTWLNAGKEVAADVQG